MTFIKSITDKTASFRKHFFLRRIKLTNIWKLIFYHFSSNERVCVSACPWVSTYVGGEHICIKTIYFKLHLRVVLLSLVWEWLWVKSWQQALTLTSKSHGCMAANRSLLATLSTTMDIQTWLVEQNVLAYSFIRCQTEIICWKPLDIHFQTS